MVALLELGHSNKLIALELGLAQSTVSTMVRVIGKRLGARSRLELVRFLASARSGVLTRLQ